MPKIIALAGGSGSGKTTLARAVVELFPKGEAAILSQDSYYFDQSSRFDRDGGQVNFDHPSSLDFALLAEHLALLRAGKNIQVPVYDFATHSRRAESLPFAPVSIIIVDGTMILSQPNLRKCFDHSIFLRTPEETRFSRRLKRDIEERGRTPEGVRAQFAAQVKPMHDAFVEPSSHEADLVLDGSKSIKALILDLRADSSLGRSLPQNHQK